MSLIIFSYAAYRHADISRCRSPLLMPRYADDRVAFQALICARLYRHAFAARFEMHCFSCCYAPAFRWRYDSRLPMISSPPYAAFRRAFRHRCQLLSIRHVSSLIIFATPPRRADGCHSAIGCRAPFPRHYYAMSADAL